MSALIKCSGNSLVFSDIICSYFFCLLPELPALPHPCLFVGLTFQPHFFFIYTWSSLVAQTVKRPLIMRETRVRSLGCEDPLEKEMATHSNILAWRIPWTEEPGGLQSTGSQRVGHDWVTLLTYLLMEQAVSNPSRSETQHLMRIFHENNLKLTL